MRGKRPPGRPSIGETRRIALTLPPHLWQMLDNLGTKKDGTQAKQSEVLRTVLEIYRIRCYEH